MDISSLPISKSEAIRAGLNRYFTGKPCKRGHLSARDTNNSHCLECKNIRAKRYRKENADRISAYHRAYYEDNKEKHRASCKAWAERNAEKVSEYSRNWYQQNKERLRQIRNEWQRRNPEKTREYFRRWLNNGGSEVKAAYRKANAGRVRSHRNKRRVMEVSAIPIWLSEAQWDAIFAVYDEAVERSLAEGIEYEVDHIIPLQGESVCGLHVPWNLQVLTRAENRSKGNKILH